MLILLVTFLLKMKFKIKKILIARSDQEKKKGKNCHIHTLDFHCVTKHNIGG
jgi:hypothetical protein